MDFFQNTIDWIKGELLESKLIIAFGLSTVLIGVLFWKLGSTPSAKALLLPFLIVGGIYTSIGGNMLLSNQKRMIAMQLSYQKNKTDFIENEKKRVEDFQYQYKISKIVATVCFTLTLFLFWYAKNPNWQGVAIGTGLFGLAGLIVDYFSEERAFIYYQKILAFLQ